MADGTSPDDELRRLRRGPRPGEKPAGMGTVRFLARCQGDAETVLLRVKDVLEVVLSETHTGKISESLKSLLPRWFLDASSGELSREAAETHLKWLKTLPREEQIRAEKEAKWSLSNWLYWFQPSERYWYWWDASVEDSNTLRIAVEVVDWPFPWGSLEWLFRAAGAIEMKAEP